MTDLPSMNPEQEEEILQEVEEELQIKLEEGKEAENGLPEAEDINPVAAGDFHGFLPVTVD